MGVRIRNIDIRKDRCLIRHGRDEEIEIPGGKAALRDWIRDKCDKVDDETLVALQLREHLRGDANLSDLTALYGKDTTLSVSTKAVVE